MPAAAPPEKGETLIVRPNGALDSVGQKNELIRVRFANMIDRLEEIRSLKEDFALLSEPVSDLIRSYPAAPVAASRNRGGAQAGDRDDDQALRRELGDLGSRPCPDRRTISTPPCRSCARPRPRSASRTSSSRTCAST